MAKRKKRRCVSMTMQTYMRLTALSKATRNPRSAIVEMLIIGECDRNNIPIPSNADVERELISKTAKIDPEDIISQNFTF